MGKFQLSEPEDIEEIRASSGASWHLKGGNLVSTKFTKKIKQFIEFCELVTHKPPKKISGNSKSTCMGLGI